MTVKELKQEWLDQLKINIFYDDNQQELCDILTDSEMTIIDNAETWFDIPNEIVYKVFDGVDFVKGDFENE